VPRSVEEWRDYLLPRLANRIERNGFLRRMYDGDHPMPTAPSQVTDKYRRLAEMSVTNLCGLVVDAPTSKLTPKGVRLSEDGDEDLELWRQVWTANRLNARCRVAHEEALKVGRSAALVWPTDDGVSVTVEDADQVIVAYAPGSTCERVAALKWYNCDGVDHVTVWTASDVESWVRPAPKMTTTYGMSAIPAPSEDWDLDPDLPGGANPLGQVPVVEFLSKPNAKGEPTPELSLSVLRLQTRINKTMFDIVVAGEDGAFPQRVMVGIEIERDASGQPINPLTSGPNRVWALQSQDTQNPSSGRIDQFAAFDTSRLQSFADSSIRELGWISRTSAIFMLGGASNVGADMIRALDDGHRAKVVAHQIVFGEAWEDVFSLALLALGKTAPPEIEIDWESPEFGSPAEMADAAIKLRQVGYSFEAVARYMGATPAEVMRLVRERNAELAAGDGGAPKKVPIAMQAGTPLPVTGDGADLSGP
jgi:hypothetical protein